MNKTFSTTLIAAVAAMAMTFTGTFCYAYGYTKTVGNAKHGNLDSTPVTQDVQTGTTKTADKGEGSSTSGMASETTAKTETTAEQGDTTTKTNAVTTGSTVDGTTASGSSGGTTLSTSQILNSGTDLETSLPTAQVISVSSDKWYLTVVNNHYKISSSYQVTLAECVAGSGKNLDYRVAPYYQSMYDAAKADGIILTPYSGYRSYERQETNFANKTAYYQSKGYSHGTAQVLASTVIMPPGCSEHNLGFAMDVCGTDNNFDQTAEFAWLKNHAADYGFILRYPADKVDITQVTYEPWHWRYVGIEAAKAISSQGITLEQYLGLA